jgi:putative transposase
MPSKNVIKVSIPDSYYHIYARGNNKQNLFLDDIDFGYFLNLYSRYLSKKQNSNLSHRLYPNYSDNIKIIAFCVMSNHFHMILYQKEPPFMEKFMRSLMTSYSKYFNIKYKRTGPVFESRYKAVLIMNNEYLQHLSRYIHLNPVNWGIYKYSSLGYYKNGGEFPGLDVDVLLEQFSSREEYIRYIASYESRHEENEELKHQLIDDN